MQRKQLCFFQVKLRSFLMLLKKFSMAIFVCAKSKAELFIFAIFCLFQMNSYSCARDGLIALLPICCTQELKNCNFLVKFKVIFVAITEFLTFGYRIRFFRSFSDYSKASLSLLACMPKSLISIAFFYQGHVILLERNDFRALFSSLSSFVFTLFAYHVVSLTASEELLI